MERYCDIVMKGGITSGVVYPLAAVELAKEHRFRNIGGTSAGAIAAAAVAAAELGRRSGANPKAYERIAELPGWLGGNMVTLFQPSRRMRPFFNTLLAGLGGGLPRKLAAPLNGFPVAAIVGLLPAIALIVAALLLDGDGALQWVAIAVGAAVLAPVGVLGAIVISALWRLRGLPDSYYGICSGNDRGGGAADAPLTRWLADLLDELAHGDPGKGPLTFGELWRLEEPDGERGVELRMMTTCLSQGRPYSLPFEGGEELWFDPDELRDLFPARVVDHMVAQAPADGNRGGLLRLPPAAQMPVVVAARMSLSFPLLIGAVPLYAENHAWEGEPRLERCWFSDGGITSNFPVHFFDSPVPRWPTYAINLIPLSPDRNLDPEDQSKNVWMPTDNSQGTAEAWVGWEDEKARKQISFFFGSIFRTAQNWIDNRQMRGPGHRDRIAHVRLADYEGGMNLSMERETIERLAERGASAAEQLSARFASSPPTDTELTWANQRWIRYRTFMALVERQSQQALRGFDDGDSGAPISELNSRPLGTPPGYGWQDEEQKAFAIAETAQMLALFGRWKDGDREFGAEAPEPPIRPWSIPRI